jgi:hypothetical protein
MAFVPVFATCLLLAAVSVTEVGLVSDMVSFLHIQKWFVKTYQINWPNESIPFGALPAHLWLDQGHTTNGAAGYGFVLGIFGLFVAWRQRNRNGKVSSTFTKPRNMHVNSRCAISSADLYLPRKKIPIQTHKI